MAARFPLDQLPESLLLEIIADPASCRALRLTSKPTLAAVDRSVTKLSLAFGALSNVAAKASTWPLVTEVAVHGSPVPRSVSRAAPAGQPFALGGLRDLLLAAKQHWPYLNAWLLRPDVTCPTAALELVVQHLGLQLTQLSVGQVSGDVPSNLISASLVATHCTQLTSLQWGCGSVNDAVFEQLGNLTTLRRLALLELVPEEDYPGDDTDMYGIYPSEDDDTDLYGIDAAKAKEDDVIFYTASLSPLSSLTALTNLRLGDACTTSFKWIGHVAHVLRTLTGLVELYLKPRNREDAEPMLNALVDLTKLQILQIGEYGSCDYKRDKRDEPPVASGLLRLSHLHAVHLPYMMLDECDLHNLARFPHLHVLSFKILFLDPVARPNCHSFVLPNLHTLTFTEVEQPYLEVLRELPPLASCAPALTHLIFACYRPYESKRVIGSMRNHAKLAVVEIGAVNASYSRYASTVHVPLHLDNCQHDVVHPSAPSLARTTVDVVVEPIELLQSAMCVLKSLPSLKHFRSFGTWHNVAR